MSQMNPKEVFHNAASSVQLPYIAGHSLYSWSFVNLQMNKVLSTQWLVYVSSFGEWFLKSS